MRSDNGYDDSSGSTKGKHTEGVMAVMGDKLDKLHFIHLEDGKFSSETDTQAADINGLLDEYSKSGLGHMVIHFHGGLVSYQAGKATAERLMEHYSEAKAYPVFFIWESGVWETICNNLNDIARESIFLEIIRKVSEYTQRKLGVSDGLRTESKQIASEQIAYQFDKWFANELAEPPSQDFELLTLGKPTDSIAELTDEDMEFIEQDLAQDQRFQDALARLTPIDDSTKMLEGKAWSPDMSSMDQAALYELKGTSQFEHLLPKSLQGAVGMITMILLDVIKRYMKGRDHRLYATVAEEVYKAYYVAKIGKQLLWDQMKKDTADAFSEDVEPDHEPGGREFLTRLANHITDGLSVPRITLVGHSTGAIYICNFIKAAETLLPAGIKFDIILLAPAVSFDEFKTAMSTCASRVGSVCLFGMKDPVELADPMAKDFLGPFARIVYPSSLLYFVSGILEDESDKPLLGMQRYYVRTACYDAAHFPSVEWARGFFASSSHRTVWSVVDGGPGASSACESHGGFDDEDVTINSVEWLLQNSW